MKCAHTSCSCEAGAIDREGRKYCSEKCATLPQGNAPSAKGCGCGHPDCGMKSAGGPRSGQR
jgi:hypothetical protein